MKMKGIISLVISICMVGSASRTAFASEDIRNSLLAVNITSPAAVTINTGTVQFTSDTVVDYLVYDGVVSGQDQLLSLTGVKPVMKISNTSGDYWHLTLSYARFTVDGEAEDEILLAVRDAYGRYDTIAPEVPHTVYIAHDVEQQETDIIWGVGEDDLVKVFLPGGRGDLSGREIETTLFWVVQIGL